MTLSLEEIKQVLPHREPFLMIDKVIDYEPGKYCRAVRAINANEWYFKGHFSDYKIFPGVLIVESMAQAGAIAALTHADYIGKLAFFRGIDKLKFKKKVFPGDVIEVYSEIVYLNRGIGRGVSKAFVNGEICAQGTLSFVLGYA